MILKSLAKEITRKHFILIIAYFNQNYLQRADLKFYDKLKKILLVKIRFLYINFW